MTTLGIVGLLAAATGINWLVFHSRPRAGFQPCHCMTCRVDRLVNASVRVFLIFVLLFFTTHLALTLT